MHLMHVQCSSASQLMMLRKRPLWLALKLCVLTHHHMHVQDNALTELPSLASHPWLTSLLLDSNHIKHLNNAGSSSSSKHGRLHELQPVGIQQHCLQELSLANNQLSTLLLSSSSGSYHGGPPSQQISSSSSSTLQLAGWLVCLEVLRLPGNQLRDLAGLQGCSSLRQLDVSRNKLTRLQVRWGVPWVCQWGVEGAM
jgi:Leucine-rich repeat (LRR) protein